MPFLEDAARVHAGLSGGIVMQSNQLVSGTIKTGTATSVGNTITLQDRPELRLDSTRLVGTGALNADGFYAYGAELAASYKNAYIQGEYYIVGVDRVQFGNDAAISNSNADGENEFSGFYVQTSWIVTGENKPYKTETATYGAPKVTAPFDLNAGTWGALELKARYSFLNLNDNAQRGTDNTLPSTSLVVRGGEQQVMGAGFNWYPNNNIRFMVDWMNVTIDKQASVKDNAQIGQNYNALGIRTQFAF
jgi:phosphate-selective porin OprO/OprP